MADVILVCHQAVLHPKATAEYKVSAKCSAQRERRLIGRADDMTQRMPSKMLSGKLRLDAHPCEDGLQSNRMGFGSTAPNKHDEADHNHRQTEPLAHGQIHRQQAQIAVRFAGKFGDKAENTVAK